MAQLEKNFDRRPDPDALLALADKEGRQAARVPRRRARRREDLRDAGARPRLASWMASMSSLASSKRMDGEKPKR